MANNPAIRATRCPYCGDTDRTVICRFCSRAKVDFKDTDGRLALRPVYPCATPRVIEPERDYGEDADGLGAARGIVAALAILAAGGLLIALLFALPSMAHGADFMVNPLRLEMKRGEKAGQVRITNLDNKAVRFVVTAAGCNEAGDICTESTESLIFYPRAMTIPPQSARVVRVGVRGISLHERKYAIRLRQVSIGEGPITTADARINLLLSVEVRVIVAGVQPAKVRP